MRECDSYITLWYLLPTNQITNILYTVPNEKNNNPNKICIPLTLAPE
jgi:hypothetical protein